MTMTAINKFFDWVARLALLNVLWILFTVLGLGFLGVFPAIAATFTITRMWVSGETDLPVVRTFWKFYKKDFIKSNILGYILSVLGYILYLDFVFLTVSPSNAVNILTIPFVLITFIFILTLLYVFPVFVYYDMKILQVIKSAFFIMFSNPLETLTMLVGTLGIGVILWSFQSIAIFFGPSVLSIIIMMPAYKAFQKVESKRQLKFQNNNQ